MVVGENKTRGQGFGWGRIESWIDDVIRILAMRSERRRWVTGIRLGRKKYKIIGVDKWSHSLY